MLFIICKCCFLRNTLSTIECMHHINCVLMNNGDKRLNKVSLILKMLLFYIHQHYNYHHHHYNHHCLRHYHHHPQSHHQSPPPSTIPSTKVQTRVFAAAVKSASQVCVATQGSIIYLTRKGVITVLNWASGWARASPEASRHVMAMLWIASGKYVS